MALKDGDKLEIQRFVTSEGFKYFFMSGLGKFTELEFYQSEDSQIPMLYQTAQFVKEMASAITYTPAPSPEWKRAVNDFYILDKGLNVNRYLTDVWREYDITSYVAEAKLDSVLYLQNANTYLDIVNTLDDEIEVVISDLEDLYDTLDIAGSPQELINNIVLNIEALNDAETEISALKKEVENFIFLVQN